MILVADQLRPALYEIKIRPLSPQQQIKLSDIAYTEYKSAVVFDRSLLQLFPESVVFNITPLDPAI